MPEIVANGVRFHYQQSGSGPDVVLVHAVTSNLAVWMFTGLVEALAADYRVTLYDLRGHGFSERPLTGYTSAEMAADFAGLHAALGLGPAALVGHSFGGVSAVHTAVEHPEIVRGVVLSDSFFPGLQAEEPNFGRANVWGDVRETYAKIGADIPDTVDFDGLFRATAALSKDQYKELEKAVGVLGRGWLRQLPLLAETTCGKDVLAEAGLTAAKIAAIPCPLAALYDEFSPFLATYEWLKANVPDCRAEIIPGAKHLAFVDNPAGFTDAVKRHVAAFPTA